MTQPTRPIPTNYAGCRFRSRLEARWAVFFDTLGLAWDYEPQGYVIDGTPYLPDFWLHDLNAWFEVKGEQPTPEEIRLTGGLAAQTSQTAYVAWGPIPRHGDIYYSPNNGILALWDSDYTDNDYAFCRCPICGKIGLQWTGHAERICKHEEFGIDATGWPIQKHLTEDHPDILHAYTKARSARFEHGESP